MEISYFVDLTSFLSSNPEELDSPVKTGLDGILDGALDHLRMEKSYIQSYCAAGIKHIRRIRRHILPVQVNASDLF